MDVPTDLPRPVPSATLFIIRSMSKPLGLLARGELEGRAGDVGGDDYLSPSASAGLVVLLLHGWDEGSFLPLHPVAKKAQDERRRQIPHRLASHPERPSLPGKSGDWLPPVGRVGWRGVPCTQYYLPVPRGHKEAMFRSRAAVGGGAFSRFRLISTHSPLDGCQPRAGGRWAEGKGTAEDGPPARMVGGPERAERSAARPRAGTEATLLSAVHSSAASLMILMRPSLPISGDTTGDREAGARTAARQLRFRAEVASPMPKGSPSRRSVSPYPRLDEAPPRPRRSPGPLPLLLRGADP